MKKVFLYGGIAGALLSASAFAQTESKFYVGAGFGTLKIADEDNINFSDADNAAIQFGYKITENFAIEAQYSKSTNDATAKNVAAGDLDISEIWWDKGVIANPGFTKAQIKEIFPYATATVAMNFDTSIATRAIYGVYRSSGDLYFKVKAGYLSEKATVRGEIVSADVYGPVTNEAPIAFTTVKGDSEFDDLIGSRKAKISETDSGFSGGLGAGYKFNSHISAELEYTRVEADVNFLSLSANYSF